jgi:hypothetical protein
MSGSRITDADLAEFMRLKAAALPPPGTVDARHAAFQFIMSKHHIDKDNKPLQVNIDIRNNFSTYGFASDAEAAGFINYCEQT